MLNRMFHGLAQIIDKCSFLLLTPEGIQWIPGLSSLAAGDGRGGGVGVVVSLGVVRLLAVVAVRRRRRHDLPELL